MVHWNLWMLPFYHSLKNWVIPFRSERALEYISNMIWCWSFFIKTNVFSQCLVCVWFDWICIYFIEYWYLWCPYICWWWLHVPCCTFLWVVDLIWLLKLVGLILVIFFQFWAYRHKSCFYLEMHDYMGCYFLINIFITCCYVHSIVLQCQWECLLVVNLHWLQIYWLL